MLLKASTKLYRNENTSKVCNELQIVTIIIYSQRHLHIQFITCYSMYTALPFHQYISTPVRTTVSIMTRKTSDKDNDEDEHDNSTDNDDDKP